MLLRVTKDFALHYLARRAASDRAKTVRAHKIAVALYYITPSGDCLDALIDMLKRRGQVKEAEVIETQDRSPTGE